MKIKEAIEKDLIPYNIFLVGFMGTGKTTVTSRLHKLLGREMVDTDEMIVEMEKTTIPEIFEKHGEPYFRDCETRTLEELKHHMKTIVSCGGGIVLRQQNVDLMHDSGRIVLLTATPETVLERVRHSTHRPILNGNMNTEFIAGLQAKRRDYYQAAADVVIETDGKDVEAVCEEIVAKLAALDADA